jgi:hypothetical protein
LVLRIARVIVSMLGVLSAAGCSSVPDAADAAADAGVDATLDASIDAALEAASPCPPDMSYVQTEGGVCIDLYEGALVQITDAGVVPWPHYDAIDAIDASMLYAVPAKGIFPQAYISEVQASAMCAQANKRLCTFVEWTAACRGQPEFDYVYPYGNTYDDAACNENRESPIIRLFGPNPSYSNAELNDPECDQLDAGLAQGGDFPKCVSVYGAYDMHGNIHEWIDDTPNPAEPTHGSFMGGYFVDAELNGPGCEYRTTAHDKTYHDYSTGFRCCANPW